MRYSIQFKAQGHPNITSRHKTTLMTTTEPHVTKRGDCIVAVNAETGLAQLPTEVKQAARDPDTIIVFTLQTDNQLFTVKGKGHPKLTYADPIDMVARKSNFTCDRTLMVASNKASLDLPPSLVDEIRDPETRITIKITYM